MADLKLNTKTGIINFENVNEFASSFNYFFVRLKNGKTISLERSNIYLIERKTKTGSYKKVKLVDPYKK